MTDESLPKSCPRCNSLIPADAPGGLCPRCLMQFVALSTGGTDFPSRENLPPDIAAVRAAFPHLEILELVGQGGMGAVFKARQTKLDRLVALKILPLRLAKEPLFAERFEREGRLLARLSHPNIVGVHDFGQVDGLYYLIMEYVDGVNLRQALATTQFNPQQSLSVIPKICEALQFAHDEGVLHRDIKPENILLDTKGRVKIADFGIAKFSGVDDKTGLTATGATIGTPHYMAPEQIERPSDVDHRADIFSLGVVFYEMLTGELPLGRFAAPSERKETLDARIDQVVMRALEKDRDRRQQSANEVRTQVEFLSNHSASEEKASAASNAIKPPVIGANALLPQHEYRPSIAIALVIASIALPLVITSNFHVPIDDAYLGMLAAWFGFPGTLLGIFHLQYLGRSGQRKGLIPAVLASTFWPFSLTLGVILLLAWLTLRRFHNSISPSMEPLVVTLVLVLGLVATVLGARSILAWIARNPTVTGLKSKEPHPVERVLRFVSQVLAGTVWTLFGLAIIYVAPPGSLEMTVVIVFLTVTGVLGVIFTKQWIEGSKPDPNFTHRDMHPVDLVLRFIGKLIAAFVWVLLLAVLLYFLQSSFREKQLAKHSRFPTQVALPELKLGVKKISTVENVLVVDVFDIDSSTTISMMETEGGEPIGTTESPTESRFRIEFSGPNLHPDATVLAAENYQGTCFFPGPSEEVSFDLSNGKTATLAFAFPDANTAKACKIGIERQLRSGQLRDGVIVGYNHKTLLFQATSVYGEYNVYAEPFQ